MTEQQTAPIVGAAKAYRAKFDEGVTWIAPSGGEILIRKLSITDRIVLDRMPDHLRRVAFDIIDRDDRLRGPDAADESEGVNPFDGMSTQQKLDTLRELVVNITKIGWVAPRLVDTVTDPDHEIGVHEIGEIPGLESDMTAYMQMVFSGDQAEAQKLATFPGQPSPGVGARPALPAVQPATERGPGTEDGGDLRSDAV